MRKKMKVGISIGDPNGIGIELILKTLQNKDILDFFTPVIFASTKIMNYQKNILDLNMFFQGVFSAKEALDKKINVVNLIKENLNVSFGSPTEESIKMANLSLISATDSLLKGEIDTLICAPMNPDDINFGDSKVNSLTYFFEKKLKVQPLPMMIDRNGFKTAILDYNGTESFENSKINYNVLKNKITLLKNTLVQDYEIEKPKIAILDSSFDKQSVPQEKEMIISVINDLFGNDNILVFGPYHSNQFFENQEFKHFNVALSIYTPSNISEKDNCVIFIGGIPQVITFVDTDPQYEVAGKNSSDYTTFERAIFESINILRRREEYFELTSNPLKKVALNITDIDEDINTDDVE